MIHDPCHCNPLKMLILSGTDANQDKLFWKPLHELSKAFGLPDFCHTCVLPLTLMLRVALFPFCFWSKRNEASCRQFPQKCVHFSQRVCLPWNSRLKNASGRRHCERGCHSLPQCKLPTSKWLLHIFWLRWIEKMDQDLQHYSRMAHVYFPPLN